MFKKTLILIFIIVAGMSGYLYGYKRGNTLGYSAGLKKQIELKKQTKPEDPKPTGPSAEGTLRVLTGDWQSVSDKKLTRQFTASSTVIDFYANKKVSTSELVIFNVGSPDPEMTYPIENGRTYLKFVPLPAIAGALLRVNTTNGTTTTTAETGTSAQYFKVEKITATDLSITALDTQKTLNFKRIK